VLDHSLVPKCEGHVRDGIASGSLFPYSETNEQRKRNRMTIHLTPGQEQRVQAVMGRGSYASVEEVVDAGLAAVEERIVPGFAGTQEELNALLAEGLASKELTEAEFWGGVNTQTDSLLVDHNSGLRS